MKAANADGVSDVASAGGGRPVSFAMRVLNHLRIVKMPRTEPRVFRRLPNCSATDTIAGKFSVSKGDNYRHKSKEPDIPKKEL